MRAYSFDVRPDQSTEAAYKASDLLAGKALDIAPTEEAILLPAKPCYEPRGDNSPAGAGFTPESLAAAAVSVRINGVKCGSVVDLSTGTATATGDATTVVPLRADNAYKAIIVPQTVAEGNLFTVAADGREFNLSKGFTFVAGQSHKFTVTLSKTSNGGVTVGINPMGRRRQTTTAAQPNNNPHNPTTVKKHIVFTALAGAALLSAPVRKTTSSSRTHRRRQRQNKPCRPDRAGILHPCRRQRLCRRRRDKRIYRRDYRGTQPGTLQSKGNRGDNVRHTFDAEAYRWNSAYDLFSPKEQAHPH